MENTGIAAFSRRTNLIKHEKKTGALKNAIQAAKILQLNSAYVMKQAVCCIDRGSNYSPQMICLISVCITFRCRLLIPD